MAHLYVIVCIPTAAAAATAKPNWFLLSFSEKSWLRSSCTVIFHWRTQSINWSGGERQQQEQGRREREKKCWAWALYLTLFNVLFNFSLSLCVTVCVCTVRVCPFCVWFVESVGPFPHRFDPLVSRAFPFQIFNDALPYERRRRRPRYYIIATATCRLYQRNFPFSFIL